MNITMTMNVANREDIRNALNAFRRIGLGRKAAKDSLRYRNSCGIEVVYRGSTVKVWFTGNEDKNSPIYF